MFTHTPQFRPRHMASINPCDVLYSLGVIPSFRWECWGPAGSTNLPVACRMEAKWWFKLKSSRLTLPECHRPLLLKRVAGQGACSSCCSLISISAFGCIRRRFLELGEDICDFCPFGTFLWPLPTSTALHIQGKDQEADLPTGSQAHRPAARRNTLGLRVFALHPQSYLPQPGPFT